MHILNRLAIITVMGLALVPLLTSAFLFSPPGQEGVREAFDAAVKRAGEHARWRAGLGARASQSRRVLSEMEEKLLQAGKEKRAVRLRLAAVIGLLRATRERSDLLLKEQERVARLYKREREKFAEFVRLMQARRFTVFSQSPPAARLIVARLFHVSLGEAVTEDLREEALSTARQELMAAFLESRASARLSRERLRRDAGPLGGELAVLRPRLWDLQTEYLALLERQRRAEDTIVVSEEEMQEIQRIDVEVQREILKLQAELQRIDARIRRKVERELIGKGLRAPRPGSYSDGRVVGGPVQGLLWPVRGRISARYLDTSYERIFRVPHRGMDIAVPQGTPVYAALDGIVFLARDGGQRGYSYILIGHQQGIATLYGHLSSFTVSTGDFVKHGQLVGFSGGARGAHGSGPMTTGPHLHFELMENGAHVDPQTMLP